VRLRSARHLTACSVALFLSVGIAGASDVSPGEAEVLDAAGVPAEPDSPEAGAILYYFHRTFRCHSCLTMEAYIEEALQTNFAEALRSGRLLWLPTNVEDPENTHFEEDFSLEFNEAVLVRLDHGVPASWTKLEKVWDLLESKEEFLGYVTERVDAVLSESAEEGESGEQS
jgi:hypothetical protein